MIGYLAARDYLEQALIELGVKGQDSHKKNHLNKVDVYDHLVLLNEETARSSVWSENIWLNPEIVTFESINDAAAYLKSIQKGWTLYSITCHRRAKLIEDKLSKLKNKPLNFLGDLPLKEPGSWGLIDQNKMVVSSKCTSFFPNGEINFDEDKVNPPSRAYIKLWELFTKIRIYPKPGDLCIDLGGSPGGWTWVLQGLGARVISIDKAPLAEHIAKLPRVEYRKQSAFSLIPKDADSSLTSVDWLFSDVICYPEKLYQYIQKWIESGYVKNFVCTIKFQGTTDFETIKKFSAIPGSQLFHLHCNKHELTWIKLANTNLLSIV